jgi:hypothetical protein
MKLFKTIAEFAMATFIALLLTLVFVFPFELFDGNLWISLWAGFELICLFFYWAIEKS